MWQGSSTRFTRIAIAISLVFLGSACQANREEVWVFHAASLSRLMGELEEGLRIREPKLVLRCEPSGSQTAARKISELNRRADVVISADARVIDELLQPRWAGFNLQFATGEIVLAHAGHSRLTETIDANNWPQILLDPEVRVGRANEQTAPLGYQTLLVWKLAERQFGGDFAARLRGRIPTERVVPDVEELASLLESRTIDYAFLYRNVAEDHNLKITVLPSSINLSDPALAGLYAQAELSIPWKENQPPKKLLGKPIVFGLTLPLNSPNPSGAARVVSFLLSSEGKTILKRRGLRPLLPPVCDHPEAFPLGLRPLLATHSPGDAP